MPTVCGLTKNADPSVLDLRLLKLLLWSARVNKKLLLNGKPARPTVKNAVTAHMNSKSLERTVLRESKPFTTELSTPFNTQDQAPLTHSELDATPQLAERESGHLFSLNKFAILLKLPYAQLNFVMLTKRMPTETAVTTRSLFNGNTPLDVKTPCMVTTCATMSSCTLTLTPEPATRLRELSTQTISNSPSTTLSMVLSTLSALLLAMNVESQSNLNALTSRDQLAPSLSHLPASPPKFQSAE